MQTAFSNGIIGRITNYGKRHGWRATFSRALLAIKRAIAGSRMVLFECDLRDSRIPDNEAEDVTIERRLSATELDPADLNRITGEWNDAIASRLMRERFGRKAALWLLKSHGRLAAYGWTLRGETIEPHYYPLSAGDVHLFDFFVFPEFRGRRFNPILVNHILARLKAENNSRAFIEAAEWNTAQLTSLSRTPFHRMGCARKFQLFGKSLVLWSGREEKANVPS